MSSEGENFFIHWKATFLFHFLNKFVLFSRWIQVGDFLKSVSQLCETVVKISDTFRTKGLGKEITKQPSRKQFWVFYMLSVVHIIFIRCSPLITLCNIFWVLSLTLRFQSWEYKFSLPLAQIIFEVKNLVIKTLNQFTVW